MIGGWSLVEGQPIEGFEVSLANDGQGRSAGLAEGGRISPTTFRRLTGLFGYWTSFQAGIVFM
jgi:hypothetical protein